MTTDAVAALFEAVTTVLLVLFGIFYTWCVLSTGYMKPKTEEVKEDDEP